MLDAFRTYMAQDNDGRGVVLVGHSQGTGMLAQLIAEEIDPNEDVATLLVSAYLAGGSITVPEGEVVGGEFEHIPMCTSADETGCVVDLVDVPGHGPAARRLVLRAPRRGRPGLRRA